MKMLKRPKILDLFSVFLIGVAVSLPIQIMFIYGHTPTEMFQVLTKVTTLNWLIIFALLGNAYLVHKADPVVRWTLPLAALLVGFNNFVVGRWGFDFSSTQTWLASAGFILCHGILCRKPILDLFKHPEHRWWLRPMRKKVEILAYISPYNGLAFKTKTFDISEGGAFIPVNAEDLTPRGPKGVRNRFLVVDDRVSLCLTLGLAQLRCDGRIVRNVTAKGIYPSGIGISFEGMQRTQKKELRRFIRNAGMNMRDLAI
jgi:hypothetical protein